jgi:membrane protein
MATERPTPPMSVKLRPPRLASLERAREEEEERSDVTRQDEAPLAPRAEAKGAATHRRWSVELFRAAYARLGHDDGDGLAAGLAFGALLSIAPLLLVVLAVSSAVLGDESSRAQLDRLVSESLGHPAVTMIDDWITQARAWSGTATVVGLIMFLIGSARLVGLVDGAFKVVFDVEPKPAPTSFLAQVGGYFASQAKTIGVTLGAGLLMVASLVLRAIGESVFDGIDNQLADALWMIGREVASFFVWMVALALVYWALPPIRLRPSDIWQGAFVSALLVEATLLVLRLGASYFDFGAAYGTAGAVVGTLVTLFIVGDLFMFGAELTAELSSRRGMKVRSSRDGCPKRVAPPRAVA